MPRQLMPWVLAWGRTWRAPPLKWFQIRFSILHILRGLTISNIVIKSYLKYIIIIVFEIHIVRNYNQPPPLLPPTPPQPPYHPRPSTRSYVISNNGIKKISNMIYIFSWWRHQMETFSAFLSLYEGKSTGHRWISLTKASNAELWCILWCAPEQTVEMLAIWDAISLSMSSL